jgi:hypothetical protein
MGLELGDAGTGLVLAGALAVCPARFTRGW